ncbi:hypothetical protein P152DRAFT_97561 [Eremomyces bilateralis CBS 781.70]|uniref:Uncharacterized protein n=1 Tax=Eremomyces bilateralis CBS 781.70 TaxID=1392243 RepID=A0A6G1FXM1_9PEZI|nr:uncharacterized protein P152DRAFT_97561 [Eremomyces bilateralis CBS 781.70]KAF1810416.1 hypothetical protein P152DRAFT_97561 [Eremomyces bilateralis CBS 781.70]
MAAERIEWLRISFLYGSGGVDQGSTINLFTIMKRSDQAIADPKILWALFLIFPHPTPVPGMTVDIIPVRESAGVASATQCG